MRPRTGPSWFSSRVGTRAGARREGGGPAIRKSVGGRDQDQWEGALGFGLDLPPLVTLAGCVGAVRMARFTLCDIWTSERSLCQPRRVRR